MRVFNSVDELRAAKGEQIGVSDWFTIDQERVNKFADASADHQWIHTDPELAADGPFGGTIVHGFLTLGLIPMFSWQVFRVEGVKMTLNYGLNRVRFTAPVPVDSRVRASFELADVTDVNGGVQVTNLVTIELEGSQRPALVAESLLRHYV